MFNDKANQLIRATKALVGKARELGDKNKNYLLLMALAGVLEHAHASAKQSDSPAADDANNTEKTSSGTASQAVEVAVENADIQQEIQKILADLAKMEPALQELVDGQIKLALVDPATGIPCVGNDACVYVIGPDGNITYFENGNVQALSDQAPLLYAQAETAVVTDATAGAGAATGAEAGAVAGTATAGTATAGAAAASAAAISTPMIAALGVLGALGVAAAAGGSSTPSAPANSAPTAVALSASTVAENAAGAVIGNLTVTDPDAGNTHTLSVDDARFEVVTGQLKLKAGTSLDFETAASVNVTVTATDGGGLSKAQAFAITVTNVNEAPTAVALSASTVAENAAGAVIGNLTVTDPDTGNTHTLTVDDDRFEVVAGQLKLKAGVSLDHEVAVTVNVTVTATDGGGLSKAQAFAIAVTDVEETTTLVGTAGDDTINQTGGLDDFIITGLAGNDIITTGSGNDIIRPGEGADTVNTGAANDIVVVVGQTAAEQYAQSDITNPGDSRIDLSSVITLADLNGRAVSEVVAGESIDGGAGTNRLVIYGNVDFTSVTLTNITQFQVNSTVTISAQQLNALGLSVIFGDGESVLNITNNGTAPVTVDLSGMTFTDFRTLNVGSGITVVLDQADADSLQYLSGEGTIKASTATVTLNLASKYVTLAVQNKDGIVDATHGGGTFVAGKLLIGTESADTLTGGDTADRLEGGAGNDTLIGGDGNDVLRGGADVDMMDGGAGDDTFVIVGDVSGGGKVDSAADTTALGFPLTNLNGKDLNEDADGAAEIIRGGDGNDTLYVYGTADLSKYDITGIEHIVIRSQVTFSKDLMDKLLASGKVTLTGDGSSVLRLEGGSASDPLVLDLTNANSVTLAQIGQISLGPHVVLKIASLNQLGGARILTGNGTIEATSGAITLPSNYTLQSGLSVKNADGSTAIGSAEVLEQVVIGKVGTLIAGGNGDDYLIGTDSNDRFDGGNGNDVFTGKNGNDTFIISGTGKKTILDTAVITDIDTIDLSKAGGAAIINLTDGGTVGTATTIQLGSGSASGATLQDAPKVNLMLILDVSGSMAGTRLSQMKTAANDLLNAYDHLGDVAVRIITFQSSATSTFNGINGWMNVSAAKSVINGLVANGGTDYAAAMDLATAVFNTGKGSTFFDKGADISFFLSDGEPNASVANKETAWENFLIQNQITSHAIGFGGLNSTAALEPIAFDGTKVKLPTDDHTPGEIGATLTVDTNKLSADLVAKAKLDFIENIVGTGLADTLTGNGLDNRIEGGAGNDVLKGLGGNDTLVGGVGDKDVAVFRGTYGDGVNGEYEIRQIDSGLQIRDKVLGRDGIDIIQSIEYLRFSDSASDLLVKDIFKAKQLSGITDANPIDLLAKFAKAAYWDVGGSDYDDLANNARWTFLTSNELGYNAANEVSRNGRVYFENGGVIEGDGSTAALIHGSAGAIAAIRGDSLVVSFRGTEDVTGPGTTQLEKFEGLLQAVIKTTLRANTGKEIYDSNGNQQATDGEINAAATSWSGALSKAIRDALPWDDDKFEIPGVGLTIEGNADGSISIDGTRIDLFAIAKDKTVVKTDSYYWIEQSAGYELFNEFVSSVKKYVNDSANGITKVYFTGHSLGAGMASWYLMDPDNGFSDFLKSGKIVYGASFAAPGMIIGGNPVAPKDVTYYRFENAWDIVPDVTQVIMPLAAGITGSTFGSFSPGLAINSSVTNNLNKIFSGSLFTEIHSMDTYVTQVNLIKASGIFDDLVFLENNTNIFSDGSVTAPVDIIQLNSVLGASNTLLSGITEIGDGMVSGKIFGIQISQDEGEWFGLAENWSDNDIFLSTLGNDVFEGDAFRSGTGSNDIFYLTRGGKDTVYGDTKSKDNLGMDTVVYNFSDVLSSTNNLSVGSVSGIFSHTKAINTVKINIDGSEDTINDIEQFHFIDTASNSRNLLVGSSGDDTTDVATGKIKGLGTIDGQGGNDFLYGGSGNDTLIGGSGNDRIHGGAGTDTATFSGTKAGYSFSIENWALKVQEADGTDYLYDIEYVSFNDGSFTSASVLSLSNNALLALYAPVIGYSGTDQDNMQLFAKATGDAAQLTLNYALYEDDFYLDSDDYWYFQIRLGEDLLPRAFIAEQDGALGFGDNVQVRNPFDSKIAHAANRPIFFVKDSDSEAWLTEYRDPTVTWIGTDSVGNLSAVRGINGLGVSYTLKGAADQIKQLSLILGDDRAISNLDGNPGDYDDLKNSDMYAYKDGGYVVAGLPVGDMALGFLFDDTPLASLGHFDLV